MKISVCRLNQNPSMKHFKSIISPQNHHHHTFQLVLLLWNSISMQFLSYFFVWRIWAMVIILLCSYSNRTHLELEIKLKCWCQKVKSLLIKDLFPVLGCVCWGEDQLHLPGPISILNCPNIYSYHAFQSITNYNINVQCGNCTV